MARVQNISARTKRPEPKKTGIWWRRVAGWALAVVPALLTASLAGVERLGPEDAPLVPLSFAVPVLGSVFCVMVAVAYLLHSTKQSQ
jgi:hypothetical protein